MSDLKSFVDLKKNIRNTKPGFKTIKVAVLSDTASSFFCTALKGESVDYKLNLDLYEADYDQIEQEFFNPQSKLNSNYFDFVILLRSPEKLLSNFQNMPIANRSKFAEIQKKWFQEIFNNIGPKTKLICNTFPFINDGVYANYGAKLEDSFTFQLRAINYELQNLAAINQNVFICDLDQLQNIVGIDKRIDPKFYFRAKIAFSLDFLPLMASNYIGIIRASLGNNLKKCLILDLDNTTWGGIIGDDGLKNIQIGDLGIGKAFDQVQHWAKSLKERGIIICICSKNTESIAKEPFEKHPDMILKLDDISVFVANWENKADNIRYIQSVLNIGFDSMVFIDDNSFERNLVRQELPDVLVPELPEDPSMYHQYLSTLNIFETASVAKEDNERTKMYQVEAKRKEHSFSYTSYEDYLDNLEMEVEILPFSDFTIPRVAQLSQRSNQFNLRTIRYSESELKQMIDNPNFFTFTVDINDRFGSYGIISIIIGEVRESTLFIDTWIMSCRVLKRNVELFVLNSIVEFCNNSNIDIIVGEYIPTAKNVIVKDHYKKLGFYEKEGNWYIDVGAFVPFKTHIKNKLKINS